MRCNGASFLKQGGKLCNTRHPQSSLDGSPPDQGCFNQQMAKAVAAYPRRNIPFKAPGTRSDQANPFSPETQVARPTPFEAKSKDLR